MIKANRRETERDSEAAQVAERALLGCIAVEPRFIDRALAIVQSHHFHLGSGYGMGRLWAYIADLRDAGRPIDLDTIVLSALNLGALQEIVGTDDRREAMDGFRGILLNQPNGSNAVYFAQEVVRLAGLRKLEQAIHVAIQGIDKPNASPQELLDALIERAGTVGQLEDKFVHIADAMDAVLAKDEKPEQRTLTPIGFGSLDKLIGGIGPGDLVLLGGRTGIGKSAFVQNVARNLAMRGKAIWFASLEMEAQDLAKRALSSDFRVSMNRWPQADRDGTKAIVQEELKSISDALPAYRRAKYWITEAPESIQSIATSCRLRKATHGLDVLIIDNLQIMKTTSRLDRHQQLKEITVTSKHLAKDLGIAIVLLSQLSVDADDPKAAKDVNTLWAESRTIVNDADIAMILMRDKAIPENATLHITKNRRGQKGSISLHWDGEFQSFSERASGKEWKG